MPDCTQSHTAVTHTHTRSLTHTHTNKYTYYHSVQFSFCLTYTLTIIAIYYKYQSLEPVTEGGREGREQGREGIGEGKEGVVMCDLNYIVFQAVPECFGPVMSSTVVL